ncbi:hypothetical protein SZ64_15840 [Erythrobacter sp. SG61-1L]|uniref:hypothetical protein n=1 Tax=Erythrobacter sp. SG61-1L TaxID=1603897 RepID=UPI0006C938E2|nr:hypothetical protein [Erythrobacter sp. SG61-1L]KPL69448.1 hypothetical protein SZ64_15840 [Erythrobacter sp. SG61-1L]
MTPRQPARALSASVLAATLALAACATPQAQLGQHEQLLSRFEAALAAQDSATAALEGWCAARGIAQPARIVASPAGGPIRPATTRNRIVLEVSESEPVGYRHVALRCGDKILSEAHNWYVPGRLTPEINQQLETSDIPFGKAVKSLGFTRERLFETRGPIEGCPPDTILHHRAVLRLPDGRPISTVIECYTAENLR